MKKTIIRVHILAAVLLLPVSAGASPIVIDFEGVSDDVGLVNVSPEAPYTEDGFTLTPTTQLSAVFDSASGTSLVGNVTDAFGFAGGNHITLSGPSQFSLNTLLLGPLSFGVVPLDITVVGHFLGGGSSSLTFAGLTTAVLASPNWSGLTRVEFRATSDSGIDNLNLDAAPVPEPASLSLLALGLISLGVRRWWQRKA